MLLVLSPTERVEVQSIDPERLVVRVEWTEGHQRPPAHYHPTHAERFEVIEGELGVRVGAVLGSYRPGDAVDIPAGAQHAMWPLGRQAVAIWESRPSGRVLDMFQELDRFGARAAVLRLPAQALVLGRYPDMMRLAVPLSTVVNGALAWAAAILPHRTTLETGER